MNESLKVLLVNRALPCHVRGGLEFHTLDLARGLRGLGAEVDLLTVTVPDDYRAELEREGFGVFEIAGVPADRYSLAYLRRAGPAIERCLKAKRYDVVHGQEFAFGFWNPPRGLKPKIVLTVHGTITSETPLHPDVLSHLSAIQKAAAIARYGRRFLFSPSWHRMLDRADAILVDSEFTQRELGRVHASAAAKIARVPLGVDLSKFPEITRDEARKEIGLDPNRPVFVTLGRITWQKGHDIALRALAQLKDRPWHYFIACQGQSIRGLMQLTDRLSLKGRVNFVDLDDSERALLLAAADVFLWPERTHPAFGLVGLEAMLMNTPVIGTRRGAIPELIGDAGGWVIEPENVGAMKDAIARVLANPSEIEAKRKGLRERTLERFRPEAMASETLAVYRKTAAG